LSAKFASSSLVPQARRDEPRGGNVAISSQSVKSIAKAAHLWDRYRAIAQENLSFIRKSTGVASRARAFRDPHDGALTD